MNHALVADLGLGPEVWLFLSLLSCVTLFFKFNRFWSVRNLDLFLLFAWVPGMMVLVGHSDHPPWIAFAWLFVGSMFWLVRCLLDLGLRRRPLLEPNLNAAGLACLSVGVLTLLVAETVHLPVEEGVARNPADPGPKPGERGLPPPPGASDRNAAVNMVLRAAPLPSSLKRSSPQVVLSRVLASLAHLGLVAGLIAVGWTHFERLLAGLAAATCYLLLPYTRIAVVDCGQLVAAALIVAAIVFSQRPAVAGGLIGLAVAWIPAAIGLVPLWSGFYRRRGMPWFLGVSVAMVVSCAVVAWAAPGIALWARALGARNLADAGLLIGPWSVELPQQVPPFTGSLWTQFDPSFRLPVLIAYLALVVATVFWPAEKDLGELIALSAALLVASQFWYLDAGGTLILLYLPLVLLMMFRPNLGPRRQGVSSSVPGSIPRTAVSVR